MKNSRNIIRKKNEFKLRVVFFVTNMDNLISEFQKQNISPSIDSICNELLNVSIDYDERAELFEYVELEKAGKSELRKTDERYARYLRTIDIWIIDGFSYEYIRKSIKKYLSMDINDENLRTKLMYMRSIDEEIVKILKKYE